MTLYAELKRRNVFRVGIAYAVASWLLLQVVDVVAPILELPEWTDKLVFILLAVGFIPALIIAWAYELTPEGIKREADVDRSESITGTTGKKLNYVIIGTLVLAVVMLLVDRQLNITRPAETEFVAVEAAGETGVRSIAVLPFVNMSEDKDYFADGVTEEILNALASVKGLKVAGRTSSFAFKGQNDDLRRIGDALGVDHILEGSVRKSGDTVRITAQLIQVEDGFHVWSDTYDRELTDVFAIQDEIANQILRQLKSRLLDDATLFVEAQRTTPEVYELYLRAKQRIYSRRGSEIRIAVDELDEAIRLDPKYAPVYAQRGIATMLLSDQQYGDIADDEANRRGNRFVEQALELDPDSPEGWAGKGLYLTNQPARYDEAVDALTRALELNPNNIDASNWLQITLREHGDLLAALEIVEDISERDPLYRPAFSNAITLFNVFGRADKAEAWIKRMESFNPDNPDLLLARAAHYMFSGEIGKGLLEIERRRAMGDMSGVGLLYISVGLTGTAQYERAAAEGSLFWRPQALYEIGRKDEAIGMAREFAVAGFPGTLFYLLNRDGKHAEVVDYIEERWPSIALFAEENPGTDFGYDLMSNVAYAYKQTGNRQRFDEAVSELDRWMSMLTEQGANNYIFFGNRAMQSALKDDIETALDLLEMAVDGGWMTDGRPAVVCMEFDVLDGHPRFEALEVRMLDRVNEERAIVGLPPLDESYSPTESL